MSQQPTPEAVEAVARAIDPLAWLHYGDRRHRDLTLTQAENAIAAYLAHKQQHAPDTLAADLAAILEHVEVLTIVDTGHGFHDQYEVSSDPPSHGPNPVVADTIPEAVSALRNRIEEGAG